MPTRVLGQVMEPTLGERRMAAVSVCPMSPVPPTTSTSLLAHGAVLTFESTKSAFSPMRSHSMGGLFYADISQLPYSTGFCKLVLKMPWFIERITLHPR